MRKWYKRIFPIEANYIISNFTAFISQRSLENTDVHSEGRRVFLLDMPEYGNIGDQAIALAMRLFLEKNFPKMKVIEVEEDVLPHYIGWLKANIQRDDIICLTGGGNMGTLYPKYEAVRRMIIKKFSQNNIFVFPQSVTDTGENRYSQKEWKRAGRVYGEARNLTVMARDRASYDFLRRTLPCRVLLVPDMAFYLNCLPAAEAERKETVGICLREDDEGVITPSCKERIMKTYQKNELFDTLIQSDTRITYENRKTEVESMMSRIKRYGLVVTDRLHTVIFSYLTDTPCVLLPSKTGKAENMVELLGAEMISDSADGVQRVSFTEETDSYLRKQYENLGGIMRGMVYGQNETVY